MTTLQTRLAQADKPTRELLEEVWDAIWKLNCRNPVWNGSRDPRFTAMLDAEAWTSAVEMLVPEGCLWMMDSWGARGSERWSAGIWRNSMWLKMANKRDTVATPALALAIACLKARGL